MECLRSVRATTERVALRRGRSTPEMPPVCAEDQPPVGTTPKAAASARETQASA
jgi:hypothetical protein